MIEKDIKKFMELYEKYLNKFDWVKKIIGGIPEKWKEFIKTTEPDEKISVMELFKAAVKIFFIGSMITIAARSIYLLFLPVPFFAVLFAIIIPLFIAIFLCIVIPLWTIFEFIGLKIVGNKIGFKELLNINYTSYGSTMYWAYPIIVFGRVLSVIPILGFIGSVVEMFGGIMSIMVLFANINAIAKKGKTGRKRALAGIIIGQLLTIVAAIVAVVALYFVIAALIFGSVGALNASAQ